MDSLRAQKLTAAIIILSIMLILPPRASVAADISATEPVLTRSIQLSSGKSIVLKSETPIKRVSVANPAVVDFILLSPREIYLTGKSAGATNITFWQDSRVVAVYDVNVGYRCFAFQAATERNPAQRNRSSSPGCKRFHYPGRQNFKCRELKPGPVSGPRLRAGGQGSESGSGGRRSPGDAGSPDCRDVALPYPAAWHQFFIH